MKRQGLIFLLAILTILKCYAQQKKLDSLLRVSTTQNGELLVGTLNEISWQYRNIHLDSALVYARTALLEAKKTNKKKLYASAYNSIASAYQAKADYDSAIYFHSKSLSINYLKADSIGLADTYNNLGIIEDERGNFETSLEHYFKALRIYGNNATDPGLMPMVLSNIGIVYKKQGEYAKVLDYYQQALELYKKSKNTFGVTVTTGNIGSVMLRLKRFDDATTYALDAAEGYKKLGYHRYVPYMLNNIAVAEDSLGQYGKAEKTYLQAIGMFITDNNDYELTNTRIGFAKNQLGFKRYDIAIAQLDKALEVAQQKDFKEFEVNALQLLSEAYYKKGYIDLAYTTSKAFIIKKDSLFQIAKTKAMLELEAKYQAEKKEKELSEQQLQLVENKLEINKKNNLIYGLLAVAFLLGLIGYLFYSQQRLKNRQLLKENELKTALVQIETQNRLQDQRLRISRDLHDNIGSQLTFIISSIDTLKYGLTTGQDKIKNKLTEIGMFTKTTINELRDTIWAMNKEHITFEDLQYRLDIFMASVTKSSEHIKLNFTVDSDIDPTYTFTAEEGVNLYRIIQEAVNNALKYAYVNSELVEHTMAVSIHKTIDYFHVEVNDNGVGFNVSEVTLGNGLSNMQKRAVELNSELKLTSMLGQGTSVDFYIPVRK
ncbi:signal transduction histidine kinase [Arenibacter echinorum]|uniref:histidine kinase n=1 Tax=Arenibacter echinorum TaxID=440515 RepID=A0A327QUD0_9FLAO|nr:signal transduction histidine kinase [Arenibacter echinorum]